MLKPFLISLGLATTAIVNACATTTSLNSTQTLDHSTWVATQIQGTQLVSSNNHIFNLKVQLKALVDLMVATEFAVHLKLKIIN